jgi:hypothetical protein
VAGRKIVMAPLPPGSEFSVGPLTFRADYAYTGPLDALPKTIYVDEEPDHAAVESSNGQAAREAEAPDTTPSASAPEFPSFFGLGNHEGFPAVVQPLQPSSAPIAAPLEPVVKNPFSQLQSVQETNLPTASIAPPPISNVPPLPSFGNFVPDAGGEEPSDQGGELEPGIPGLVIDQSPPAPPPPKLEEPVKKKSSGSFLDFFSKRPTRRRRLTHLEPDSIAPINGTTPRPAVQESKPAPEPTKQAPAAAKGVWSDVTPNVSAVRNPQTEPPAGEQPAKPDSVDDDLSNFFKKLE